MRYLKRLVPYLKPYKHLAGSSIVLTLLSIGVGLAMPWPLQVLIDNVLSDRPLPSFVSGIIGGIADSQYELMVLVVLLGLVLAISNEVLTVVSNFVDTKLEQKMTLDIRSDLFAHAEHLSPAYHDKRRTGSLIYMMNSQATSGPAILMVAPPLMHSFFTLIGMFVILLTINANLAFLSLVIMPFLLYYIHYYATHIQRRIMHVKELEFRSLGIVHEAMSMIRIITAFARETFEYRRFRGQAETAVDERVKLTVRETLFTLAVNTTTAAGTALILGIGAHFAIQGKLTPGQLLVVLSYLAAVYKPLETISYTIGSLQNNFVSMQIVFNILDTPEDIKDRPDAIPLATTNGEVAFDHVAFSYDGRKDTLRDIDFHVHAGMSIGVVGPTGAGKTTLINLIPRFYEPASGSIRIDGTDIRDYTLGTLREQIGLVPQEPLLFSGSLADNIRYGNLDASIDEVMEAAKAANAHDFIMALPKKYQTEIGERGAQLSGGERQRICIARAFLKDAPILILDEPTSSVDSRTESVILDALDRLIEGRTTFIIAHRLSTIRHADLILVMDKGEIVERGAHHELVTNGGLYQQLYEMQSGITRRRRGTGVNGNGRLAAQEWDYLCPNCGRSMTTTLNDEADSVVRFLCETCLSRVEIPATSEVQGGF
jgi:ATP-binding cassette subfamily B protein